MPRLEQQICWLSQPEIPAVTAQLRAFRRGRPRPASLQQRTWPPLHWKLPVAGAPPSVGAATAAVLAQTVATVVRMVEMATIFAVLICLKLKGLGKLFEVSELS